MGGLGGEGEVVAGAGTSKSGGRKVRMLSKLMSKSMGARNSSERVKIWPLWGGEEATGEDKKSFSSLRSSLREVVAGVAPLSEEKVEERGE